ncbi:hypothetical protein BDA96_10G066600 [Sorghum bicolor]|uniref:Acidic protein n=1 Tax=Sorghum bicolor TaxID=4558 RepID=A0A921U055_SORBI|nr:hypothetical protein BDA96_10G066600 [Sorghum bicolor]
MAQVRNIVGALFIVTLILGAPFAKVDDCNKQCEGKGTPADIDHCKEKCSLTEHFSYATIGVGACRQNCDKLKNDQSSLNSCEEKCREKYEGRLSQIKQGQNF